MKRIFDKFKNLMSNRKRRAWVIVSAVVLVVLVIGGVEAYRILCAPQGLFKMNPAITTAPNAPSSTDGGSGGTSGSAGSGGPIRPDPAGAKDILNVLLIGIDRNQEGGKSAGTDYHADVMMVLAINFKEKKVDMISLPRDTFVHAPDVMDGVYKLNASFNVGGGFAAKNNGGFQKVCDAAKYMLGGIPVDYYYAVDFESLVSIVDTIGGVDYNVESPDYTLDGVAGQRHMSGADVLYYMRVRKVGPDKGDKNRVNRQKKMLVAIFDKLKKDGKLSMLPNLINAANSGIFTNTNLEQTLALANYASGMDSKKIGEHSMTGALLDKASWAYCFTDQAARIELIRQVYGLIVPEQVHCSSKYADWLVDYGFSGIRYLKTAKQMLDAAAAKEASLTSDQKSAYDALKASYTAAQSAYDKASLTFSSGDTNTLSKDKSDLKNHTEQLDKLMGNSETLKWTYNPHYWDDPAINAVKVDFR